MHSIAFRIPIGNFLRSLTRSVTCQRLNEPPARPKHTHTQSHMCMYVRSSVREMFFSPNRFGQQMGPDAAALLLFATVQFLCRSFFARALSSLGCSPLSPSNRVYDDDDVVALHCLLSRANIHTRGAYICIHIRKAVSLLEKRQCRESDTARERVLFYARLCVHTRNSCFLSLSRRRI